MQNAAIVAIDMRKFSSKICPLRMFFPDVSRTSQPRTRYATMNIGSRAASNSPVCSNMTPAAKSTMPMDIDIRSDAFSLKNPFFSAFGFAAVSSFFTSFTLSSMVRHSFSSCAMSESGSSAATLSCFVAKMMDAALTSGRAWIMRSILAAQFAQSSPSMM